MAQSMWCVVLFLLALSVSECFAQTEGLCSTTPSYEVNGMVNIYCGCLEELPVHSSRIHELTLNQTGCGVTGVELTWSSLETALAPRVVTVVGADLFFVRDPAEDSWASSIRKVNIIQSRLESLPENALVGLDLLQELRIYESEVLLISRKAVAGLANLAVVEIAYSTIGVVGQGAFSDLSAVTDFAIVFSNVSSFMTEAVTNVGPKAHLVHRPDCRGIERHVDITEDEDASNMDIMSRRLIAASDLDLPKYGTRFLLFKNSIDDLQTGAIHDTGFGFLIVGGNYIRNLYPEAFDSELYNECETSAAFFIGNYVEKVHPLALFKIRGHDGTPESTFVALSNNTFLSVAEKSFLLASNVIIFAVEENGFTCTCEDLAWVLDSEDSSERSSLERELLRKGRCRGDGTSLIAYSTTCTDHGSPLDPTTFFPSSPADHHRPFPMTTTIKPSTTTTTTTNIQKPFTPRPTVTTEPQSPQSDPSGALGQRPTLVVVLVMIFIMSLVDTLRTL